MAIKKSNDLKNYGNERQLWRKKQAIKLLESIIYNIPLLVEWLYKNIISLKAIWQPVFQETCVRHMYDNDIF